MLNDLVTLAYVVEAGEGVMRHAIEGQPSCVGRHANEFVLGLSLDFARALYCAPRSRLSPQSSSPPLLDVR